MQTLHCEKCRLLFTDALEGELSPEMQGYFVAHLEECKECALLYEDFKKLSSVITDTPPVTVPLDLRLNINEITNLGKKSQKQKKVKQWLSVAAVFLVFVSSYAIYDQQNFGEHEKQFTALKEDAATMYEDSYDAAECPPRSETRGIDRELFEEALSDPAFLAEIESANLGFGYELLESNQEEDGSTIFVIYFYEDDSYTLKTPEESIDVLSSPNVRSFHWKKNESSL